MPFYKKRTRSELFAPNYVAYKKQKPTVVGLTSGAVSALKRMTPRARRNVRSGGYTGIEKKFLDTAIATTTLTTTGVILNDTLNAVAQGDSQSQRIGRKITIKDLRIKGAIFVASDSNLTNPSDDMANVVRIIVYLDKQCNKAAATVAQILQTANYNSFRNLEFVDRFNILYDKSVALNNGAGLNNASATFYWPAMNKLLRINKKLNIPILYDSSATTGAIGTITSNNIGIMAIVQNGSAFVSLKANCRIRYAD